MTTEKCISYEETPLSKKEQRRINHPKADGFGRKSGTFVAKLVLGSYKGLKYLVSPFRKAVINPQIVWIMRDSKTEKQVYPSDMIEVKREELGKWAIVGYAKIKKRAIPNSAEISSGKFALVAVTVILPSNDVNFSYQATMPRFNYMVGYTSERLVGHTPSDVMKHCQKAFDKSRDYFLNAI